MNKQNEFPMNCVYASPEIMGKQPQTQSENPTPYPIVHAAPTNGPDKLPMECVYASPRVMDKQPYIEEVYGSPDMIARSIPAKPIPKSPPPPNHNAAFCQYCGMSTKIEVNIDETIQFCMNCGRSIPLIAKFCPFCGLRTRPAPVIDRATEFPATDTQPSTAPDVQKGKNVGLLSKLFKRGR